MRSRLSVLRHRSFLRLWLAHGGSTLGDGIILVVTALFVTELTGSATDLGLVLAAQALPLVGFLLVGGVLADRLPRARVMVWSDAVRAALQALVAVLVVTGAAAVWQLVVIGVAYGAAEAFWRPASTGLVPETVPEDEIQEARALLALTGHVSGLAGPALGTVLFVAFGAGAAFAIDAATFLLSALLLWGVRVRDRSADAAAAAPPATDMPVGLELAAGAPAAAAGWRAELAEGFLEVRRRTWVWVTVAAATISLLLALAPLFVLGPLTAEDVYGDSAVYGVVMAAFGAGAVAGALMGLRWRPRRPMLVANLVAVPWPLIGIGMALGWPLALVLAAAVAGGVGLALFEVLWETALAEHIPPRALSRVSAFDWMGSLALLPLGYAVAGPVADAVGLGTVLIAGGLVTMVVSAAAALPRQTRTLRSLERPG